MFPDLARDDAFRLETARMWLRWPRSSDEAAVQRFCSLWEVARYTARIPHPYPPGSAERFIYAAREANASGRDLTLVLAPKKGKREVIGSISLESRGADRLTLGFALAPEYWNEGLATEAACVMVKAGFVLAPAIEIFASVAIDNPASRRVLEKCGFEFVSTEPRGAPARGGMIDSHNFRQTRKAWTEAMALRREELALKTNSFGRPGMKFLDQARIYVRSGDGGAGCISFRREKFIEFGGPNGGDGGRGGDVVVVCAGGLNTLIDFRYQQHFKAKTGVHGMGKNRAGGRGADVVLKVPVGTQVIDEETGAMLADLTKEGERVVVAHGGNGGFGNAHFATSTNRAPRRANPGQPGIERMLILRLKLIADAGLVGLPNAGKSTFLAAVSAAKPKIADYPFTTLHPGLGVVRVDDREFVLADIPGLVEGAHEGHGLGDRFLGHVERCGALVHLVDATGAHAGADYRTIRRELVAYGEGIEDKAEIACLSKVDAVDEETLGKQIERLKRAIRAYGPTLADAARRAKPLLLSTATQRGVTEVLRSTMATIEARRVEGASKGALSPSEVRNLGR